MISLPDAADTHQLAETTTCGPWGGPTFSYRGARIECLKGAYVCGLFMAGHPLDGLTFGTAGPITPMVDAWLDHGALPSYLRAVGEKSGPR